MNPTAQQFQAQSQLTADLYMQVVALQEQNVQLVAEIERLNASEPRE